MLPSCGHLAAPSFSRRCSAYQDALCFSQGKGVAGGAWQVEPVVKQHQLLGRLEKWLSCGPSPCLPVVCFPSHSQVLKSLDARDWVVLLDERGKEVRSEDLARIIAAAGALGASKSQQLLSFI